MLLLLVPPLLARAMLFIPRTLGLWDQAGLMSPSDTFTMFYDARPPAGSGIKAITGIGAATSKDGVHWSDQGMSMTPFDTNSIGSGSTFRSPTNDSEYVINYSESCAATAEV